MGGGRGGPGGDLAGAGRGGDGRGGRVGREWSEVRALASSRASSRLTGPCTQRGGHRQRRRRGARPYPAGLTRGVGGRSGRPGSASGRSAPGSRVPATASAAGHGAPTQTTTTTTTATIRFHSRRPAAEGVPGPASTAARRLARASLRGKTNGTRRPTRQRPVGRSRPSRHRRRPPPASRPAEPGPRSPAPTRPEPALASRPARRPQPRVLGSVSASRVRPARDAVSAQDLVCPVGKAPAGPPAQSLGAFGR